MALTLTDELRKIITTPLRGDGTLTAPNQREAIKSSQGVTDRPEEYSSDGYFLADWIEVRPWVIDGKEREYHPVREETSSDGLYLREFQQLRTIKFLDEDGRLLSYTLQDTEPEDYWPYDPPE